MIAQELEVSLHMAFVDARASRHEFITVEHLLAALLDNATAVEVLKACAVNIAELRAQLKNFINDNTPVVPGNDEVDTQPTLGFQRVIQRAIMHVCLPLGPWVMSNVTFWFSLRVLNPGIVIALKCANNSSSPSSGLIKPKPFASLNHLTIPVAMRTPLHKLKTTVMRVNTF